MRIIAEQQLPTDLSTLRKFVDRTTQLVAQDMRSTVGFTDGWLQVISTATELTE